MSAPARPKRYSPEIKRAACEAILPRVKEWLADGHESDDDTLRDLISAADEEAYSFARRLDDKYWSPDAELVEILAHYDTHTPHQNAVKAWVVAHGITVSQQIGDVVTLRGQQARIVAIRQDTAEIIAQPLVPDGRDYGATGGWVHATEDATAARRSRSKRQRGASLMRPLRITLTPGLPDAGAAGQWLGCDRQGAVYLLRWHQAQGCWGALGFESTAIPARRPWAHLVLLRGSKAGFIIGHVEGPPIDQGAPRYIVGEAPPQIFSPSAPIATVDDAPFWPGLLWPFLPALGAAAILAVVISLSWLAGPCTNEPGRDPQPRFACWSWPR